LRPPTQKLKLVPINGFFFFLLVDDNEIIR
jgi:hypothetical protein